MGKLLGILKDILTAVREQDVGVQMNIVCVGQRLSVYKRKKGTGIAAGEEILRRFA